MPNAATLPANSSCSRSRCSKRGHDERAGHHAERQEHQHERLPRADERSAARERRRGTGCLPMRFSASRCRSSPTGMIAPPPRIARPIVDRAGRAARGARRRKRNDSTTSLPNERQVELALGLPRGMCLDTWIVRDHRRREQERERVEDDAGAAAEKRGCEQADEPAHDGQVRGEHDSGRSPRSRRGSPRPPSARRACSPAASCTRARSPR